MNSKFAWLESGSAVFRALDKVADATNLLLIIWLLAVLVVGTRQQRPARRAWLAVALSVAVVYLVKTVDSKLGLWERADWNYSTHSALAAVVALGLFYLDRPRRHLAVAVFVAYEILILALGFHSVADIASTLVVIALLAWLCHFLLRAREPEAVIEAGKNAG